MSRLAAVYMWDLMLGLGNRFLQVFALACIMGGTAMLAASPAPETLPLVLIQAILFFGSLLAMLVGWASGQQSRAEGAMLFAQPIGPGELLLGKLLGTGTWCLVLLVLFMAPAAVQAGIPGTLAALGALAVGLVLVSVLGGLLIGLLTSPVTGLLATLGVWILVIAGWEIVLYVLTETGWLVHTPTLFLVLLLINPAGIFRIGAMVGLEAVPFDTDELEVGRAIFENIWLTAFAVYALWLLALGALGRWAIPRQEF